MEVLEGGYELVELISLKLDCPLSTFFMYIFALSYLVAVLLKVSLPIKVFDRGMRRGDRKQTEKDSQTCHFPVVSFQNVLRITEPSNQSELSLNCHY